MTLFEEEGRSIRIATYSGAFGEPEREVEISLHEKDNGTIPNTSLQFSPEKAIEIGEELIRRAKKGRALRKRWERQHVSFSMPLSKEILDKEDEGCIDERDVNAN